MSKKSSVKVTPSSGNVFRDVGFSREEAGHLAIHAHLLIQLQKLIASRGLKQAEVAKGLTLDPSAKGRVFAATSPGGVYLSEDGGETWTQVLNNPAWSITIDRNVPSRIYATTKTAGVFRSLNGGKTWQDISTGLSPRTMGRSAPVIIDPTNPQVLYVASEASAGGVFKSRDGGDHWFAMNAGLDNLAVYGLAMDPSNPAALYASGPNGVYKTLDGADERPKIR